MSKYLIDPSYEVTPIIHEKALQLAVLERAYDDLRCLSEIGHLREAFNWFFGMRLHEDSQWYCYSFPAICASARLRKGKVLSFALGRYLLACERLRELGANRLRHRLLGMLGAVAGRYPCHSWVLDPLEQERCMRLAGEQVVAGTKRPGPVVTREGAIKLDRIENGPRLAGLVAAK